MRPLSHRHRAGLHRAAVLVVAACAAGCTALPDVPVGVCGNHVLEPANHEECDSAEAGCGQPGSDGQCRYSCLGGAACPTGYRCGKVDSVCRRPTGSYTFSPAIGAAGQTYEVSDLDGDGYLDLVDRADAHLVLYRNDHHGAFTTLAEGAAQHDDELSAPRYDSVESTTALSLSADDPEPLVGTIAGAFFALSLVDTQGAIVPVVYPMVPVAAPGATQPLVGAVAFDDYFSYPLFADDAHHTLVAYDFFSGQALPDPLALSSCGGAPSQFVFTFATPAGQTTLIGILGDDTTPCVALATPDQTFDVSPLSTKALRLMDPSFSLAEPVLADVDGDGLLDVLMNFDDQSEVLWRQDSPGHFGEATVVDDDFLGWPLAAADFDNNHLDDLTDGTQVTLNYGVVDPDGGGLQYAVGLDYPAGGPSTLVVGDLNRDHAADVVSANSFGGDVTVCLGNGTGMAFGCNAQSTGFRSVTGLLIADIDGDQTSDLVAMSGVPAGLDGGMPAGGGLSVVLGKPLGIPDGAPLMLRAYHVLLEGLFHTPSVNQIGEQILVVMRTSDGTQALSIGEPSLDGRPQFGRLTGSEDESRSEGLQLRFVDENGDGSPDALVAGYSSVRLYHGGVAGRYFAADPIAYPFDPPSYDIDEDFRFADLAGDDGLPSLLWIDHAGVDEQGAPQKPSLQVARFHRATSSYVVEVQPLSMDVSFLRVVDLDGDGAAEIVMVGARPNQGCQLAVGRGGSAGITVTTTNFNGFCDRGFSGLFADVAPFDGRLDFLASFADDSGVSHLRLFRAGSDGSFLSADGAAAVDPAAVRPASNGSDDSSDGGDGALLPFAPDNRWITSADFNGDGVVDVLFQTDSGMQVAFANVETP